MCSIAPWPEVADRESLQPQVESILFETAGPRSFASPAELDAFRWRWLGQYQAHEPALVHLALTPQGEVAGYVVGALADPATSPRFAELGYFQSFAPQTARYPAHLHINLTAHARGAGLGGRLIQAFVAAVAAAGAPGIHVVTGKTARNVGFYARNGFAEVQAITWNGRDIVMLAREVASR